jgi:hypothetical protein
VDNGEVRLYRRDAAIRLVREFLTRDQRDGMPVSRRHPVIVFTGPRGSGKTALLTGLTRLLDQQVPCARIDCEDFAGGAAELLPLLAFELNRRSGRYGTVPFPRLLTGLIAIKVPIDDLPGKADREAARQRVRQVLEDRKNTAQLLQESVKDAVAAGLGALGGAPPAVVKAAMDFVARAGPRLVLGWLVTTRHGRRVVLGAGQDWYGHQDREAGRDPIEVLIDLNRMAAGKAGKDGRREAADLLWAAFLADLDGAFARSRALDHWTLNCLVLLDNADAAAGRLFLDELVTARRQRASSAAAVPDPMTVVATSRGGLAERLIPRGAAIAALGEASYADYLLRGEADPARPDPARPDPSMPDPARRWWYPVSLPDLALEDVIGMARELDLPAGVSRNAVASAVYRYTSGHPGCVRALFDAMVAGHDTDLDAVLKAAEPGRRNDPPLADRLLDNLLAGVSGKTADHLVTCSAARDKEAALRLGAESGMLARAWDEDAEVFSASFWDELGAAGRTLHPVLRRLLLRRLAARNADSPANWAEVHTWLRKISIEAADETGELYHTLALGDIERVARRLAERLRTSEAEEWLGVLEAVIAAPSDLDPAQRNASRIGALTSWAGEDEALVAAVGRLVAARWIDAGPLSVPGTAGPRPVMRAAMHQIAPYSREGIGLLHEYAEKEYADDSGWAAGGSPRQPASAADVSFTPPVSGRGVRRSRRRRWAAAVLAVAAAAGTATGVYGAATGPPTCGTTKPPFQLIWKSGECVGVTDASSYIFDSSDPGIADVENRIATANHNAVTGGNYVTIALLTPLTEPANGVSDVSLSRIEDQLRGAYLAQQYVNTHGNLPFGVRLVLANEGSSEQGEPEVVSQLERLTTYPGRLLAVAGMGISVQATETAAKALGAGGKNIPMFGAVTTADRLDNATNQDLLRVVPDVSSQLAELIPFLRRPDEPLGRARSEAVSPETVLIYDRSTSDLYTESLRKDFENAFPSSLPLADQLPYVHSNSETKGVFGAIARLLCVTSGQPPVVLYAGRESVLGYLVGQLQGAGNCQGKNVTVVTGSDANALPPASTSSNAGGARVTVIYSDIEPAHVTQAFRHDYQQWLGTAGGLTDPWLIATYNAMTAAWNTIHLAATTSGRPPDQLTAGNVSDALLDLYVDDSLVGATENFSMTTNGDLAHPEVPIMRLAGGTATLLNP